MKEKREEFHLLYQLFLKLKEEIELQTASSEAIFQSPSNLDENSYDYKCILFPNTSSPYPSTFTSKSEILEFFYESFATGITDCYQWTRPI